MRNRHRLRALERKNNDGKVRYEVCWCSSAESCTCEFADDDNVIVIFWDDFLDGEPPPWATKPV